MNKGMIFDIYFLFNVEILHPRFQTLFCKAHTVSPVKHITLNIVANTSKKSYVWAKSLPQLKHSCCGKVLLSIAAHNSNHKESSLCQMWLGHPV